MLNKKEAKFKKTTYLLSFIICLLFAVYCSLFIVPVQSQTPQIEITLTWSTNTYVPLDYPGKALPSRGSTVEITANIDSPGINPQELIYNWFINDIIQDWLRLFIGSTIKIYLMRLLLELHDFFFQ